MLIKLYSMRGFFLFLFVAATHNLYSQNFIGLKRKDAVKSILKYSSDNKCKASYVQNDSDSLLSFLITDTLGQKINITVHFSKLGESYLQIITSQCDTCLAKPYFEILDNRKYKWTKLKNGKYLSEYSKSLLLDPHTNEILIISLQKLALSNKEYQQLLKK